MYLTAHGQCEVKCVLKDGFESSRKRFGLIPDGTPCSEETLDSDIVEIYQLSRWSGLDARCLQGYCYVRSPLYTVKPFFLI